MQNYNEESHWPPLMLNLGYKLSVNHQKFVCKEDLRNMCVNEKECFTGDRVRSRHNKTGRPSFPEKHPPSCS